MIRNIIRRPIRDVKFNAQISCICIHCGKQETFFNSNATIKDVNYINHECIICQSNPFIIIERRLRRSTGQYLDIYGNYLFEIEYGGYIGG